MPMKRTLPADFSSSETRSLSAIPWVPMAAEPSLRLGRSLTSPGGRPISAASTITSSRGLSFLTRQGWLARVKPLLVQQFVKNPGHQASGPFVIMNLSLGRELPNKRGLVLFEIQNLFNRQTFFAMEPSRDLEFVTERRFLFKLALYF